jgi:shikimate kinase
MARKLYTERRPFYESADARVTVKENESVEEVVKKVVRVVLRHEPNHD